MSRPVKQYKCPKCGRLYHTTMKLSAPPTCTHGKQTDPRTMKEVTE